jgi:hypothetical protein
MIVLKIDAKKLNRDWFFKGQKGTYIDLALYENDQPDDYGNTHSIKQNPPKGVDGKGHYVGNGKEMGQRQQRGGQARQGPPAKDDGGWGNEGGDDGQIPF